MQCVICGSDIERKDTARNLPRFVRCPHCTGYITDNTEQPEYPETYFVEKGKERRTAWRVFLDFFLYLRLRSIRRALHGTAPLLDYGCGNGKLISFLLRHGLPAEGYDPSKGAVVLARTRGIPVFDSIPEKQYALIMLWHSLEHSDCPLKDIRALHKRLVPGGRLLIAVPNARSLESRIATSAWFCYDWPFHRVHFTPRALATLLQKSGFRVESTDHVNIEYTISSLAQTFLNLFLPKNALYTFVANRRSEKNNASAALLAGISLLVLCVFSPFLALVWLIAVAQKRTAAFITVAERLPEAL